MRERVNVFWFRRDLRLNDNAALFEALKSGLPVLPVFIFDKNILQKLEDKQDRRVTFIHLQLQKLDSELRKFKSSLKVFHNTPAEAFGDLLRDYEVKAVFTNHDYESYARERDAAIATLCKKHNAEFRTFKDQVIFEKKEVTKDDATPYTVYTPYSKKWKQLLKEQGVSSYATEKYFNHFVQSDFRLPSLNQIGFVENRSHLPDADLDPETIQNYHLHRDIPYPGKTTHVSLHLRFGTMSIRQLVATSGMQNEKYLNELIWREFLMQILWNFPHVEHGPFRKKYEYVKWRNVESDFGKWCNGETGFPLVDAGMRELNETGFMHNRVRMVVANFLTKLLLIDWRWGEAYFAKKLTDFELSSNNGNWQWSAGCGCDAAPYFRIFNPITQAQRFDPQNNYVRKWIPGYDPTGYIKPMIDLDVARRQSLQTFKEALT